MSLRAAARACQPVGQPLEHAAKRLEEAWRDALARERFADPQAQGKRGLAWHGAEPLERADGAAGRVYERPRRHAHRAGPPTRAPARADQAVGRGPQRAGEPAFRTGREPLGRRPHGALRVSGFEREHAESVVTRHEQHPGHARRLRVRLT